MKPASQRFLLIAILATLAITSSWAQDEGPALGVARISLTNGDVTMRRGDSGDWVQAQVNMPLVEGDSIATGRASRAEVQLDYSNLLRLNESSQVNVAELGSRVFRVQVERGTVTYSELRGGEADVDVETPLVAVRPREKGLYRVEVHDEQQVLVVVRKGQAEIASTEGIETVKGGRAMLVRRGDEGIEFRVVKAEPKDDWDRWNERRDSQLRKSDSYRHLSRGIYGAEDLDSHGRWVHVSGYGHSWFPSVSFGWAPYRYGRWIWLDYYGWTWHSYEPWGWAPYHYGRWFHHAHYGWGWYPGPRYAYHYWRPALVSFFGFGTHRFSFGVGFGHFGWIPLAPGERFYPWYGRRFHHGRFGGGNTIFVDNSINIYNNYRNARHANGVTVVDAERFSRGLVSNPRSLQSAELRRATLIRGQIPVVPARESLGRIVRASNGPGPSIGPNGTRRSGGFFSTSRSGRSAVRTPFKEQQQQMVRSVRAFSDENGRRLAGAAGSDGAPQSRRSSGATSGATSGAGGVRAASGAQAATGREPRASGIGSGSTSRSSRGRATLGADTGRTVNRASESQRNVPRRGVLGTPPSVQGSTGSSSVERETSATAGGVTARGRAGVGASSSPSATGSTRWRRFDGTRDAGSATTSPRGRSSGSIGRGSEQDGGSGARLFGGRPESRLGAEAPASGSSSVRSGSRGTESGSAAGWRRFTSRGVSDSRTSGSRAVGATPRSIQPGSPDRTTAPRSIERGSPRDSREFVPRSGSRRTRGEAPAGVSRGSSAGRSDSSGVRRQGGFAPRSVSRAAGVGSSRSSSDATRGGGSRWTPRSAPRTEGGGFSSGRPISVPRSSMGSRSPSVSRAPSVRSRGGFGGSTAGRGGSISRGGSVSRGGGSVSRGGGSVSRGSVSRSSGGVRSSGGRSRGGGR